MAAISGRGPKDLGIVHHPCSPEATDRNWDAVRRAFDDLARDVISINEEVTELSPISWGVVTEDSEEGDCDFVTVNQCADCSGASPIASDITVYLPKREGWFPRLRAGDVIAYASTTSGDFVCVSDYSEGIIYHGVSTGANQTQPSAGNDYCGTIEVYPTDDCAGANPEAAISVKAPWYPGGEFKCPADTKVLYAKAEDGQWVWLNAFQDLDKPAVYYVRKFRLTASLSLTGSAAAVILNWNGAAWVEGDAITVHDEQPAPGRWRGVSGYEGWCTPRGNSATNYSIIHMDLIALRIRGILNEDMSQTVAGVSQAATVVHYHQGRDPGTVVDVYDPNGRFPTALFEARFTALYNDRQGRYELETCEQIAIFARAKLLEDSCGGATLSIYDFEHIETQEYSLPPAVLPEIATNTCNHAGLADAVVLLRRISDSPTPAWEIVDAEKTPLDVIVDVYKSGTSLMYQPWKVYVEICSGPELGVVWANGTYCDPQQQQ